MDADLDYQAMAQELLRALRGDRSTKALSEQLGFQTNVVYRWETGARRIPAHVVFALAHDAGVDVVAAVRTLIDAVVPKLEDVDPGLPMFATMVLQEVHAHRLPYRDDEGTGLSRFALRRLLIGEATLSMADLLMLAEHYRERALVFLHAFTDPSELPSAADAWRAIERAQAIRGACPWVPELLAVLRVPAYTARPAHDATWLATSLGVSRKQVDDVVASLLDAGFLTRTPVRADGTGGHYRSAREFRAPEPITRKEAIAHSQRRATQLLHGFPEERSKMYSYLAFTSQAALERVWAHLEKALSETTGLYDPAEEADRAYYAMVGFAPLDGLPLDGRFPDDDGT
ncbi:MAG: hypothetical protein H6733_03695 [Alphaproteobacteria bacterium]|nr:hypothetical protein [Alphaproteobacteria bacterium]